MEGAFSLLLHSSLCPSSANPSFSFTSLSPFPPNLASNSTFTVSFSESNKHNRRISPLNSERVPFPERARKKNAYNLNPEVSPHRAVSAVRLLRVDQGGAFADLLIEKGRNSARNEMDYVERTLGFRTRDLDDRDIRLVTDVVGGTVRWRRYLDHLIISLCNDERMFGDMEPLLLQILRIGCYEITKLGMPSYAVVDENVRLAKVALRPGAGNLVNGILRKLVLLKESDSLPVPKLEGDDRAIARALATIHSHPVWMVRRWTKFLGQEEAVKLMNWNNSDPSFSLRVNTGKGYTRADLVTRLSILKVPHELSPYIEDFVRIQTGMQIVIQAGLLKEGLCAVQDESAGLVVSVLDPQPGESIIDCCAAPGGKTLFIASRLRGVGKVLAIDINKGRLRVLKEAAKLHNVDGVITAGQADLRLFAEKNIVKANKVLLDAPCSGLGVLSKVMDRAKESIKENLEMSYRRWWRIIDKRWDKQLYQDVYAVGYFLNPRFQCGTNAKIDNEVLTGFKYVVDILVPDKGKQIAIHDEAVSYRLKGGCFGSHLAYETSRSSAPARWRSLVRRKIALNLTELALRIVSQTVSSSNCERNWTTLSLIHTKLRNRLSMKKLNDLIFIHHNMRLRSRDLRRQYKNEIIDLDQMFYEDDPLLEWTAEKEDRVMDDRDNSWLDDEEGKNNEESRERIITATYKKRDKRKKTQQDKDDDNPPPPSTSKQRGGGSRGSDTEFGEYKSNMNEALPNFDYMPSDYGRRHSIETYPAPVIDGYGDQATSQRRPFDNMMISFLGPTQMQYHCPSQDLSFQGGDEDQSFTPA